MTEPNSGGNGDGNATGNGNATPPANPSANPPALPAQPSVPQPQTQPADFAGLSTLLAALPEKVAHAVREAMPAPPKSDPSPKAPPANQPATPTNGVPSGDNKPGPNSFREWWFSGSGKR